MILRRFVPLLALAGLALALPARAADGADPKDVQAVADKAIAYLKKTQSEGGGWSESRSPVTALADAALLQGGVGPEAPAVAKALKSLEGNVKKDGGIYDGPLATPTTSFALMAFQEANKDKKYDTVVKNATTFLKSLQQGGAETDVAFGGLGYGVKSRPDLSNTRFFIDAMTAAGVSKDDPAIQKAIKFVSRCQNLPGETNDQPFAGKATDDDKGGMVYDPQKKSPDSGLRSAGAMTHAGLKCLLYAGVGKDDPRVRGAIDWIRRHYTLEENPGQGQSGLFYCYHTFGKAMTALDEGQFEDARKVKHDWRKELFEAIKKR
jgi:squalene-hopene/tetraprenyl-beta-curcumene cyclase